MPLSPVPLARHPESPLFPYTTLFRSGGPARTGDGATRGPARRRPTRQAVRVPLTAPGLPGLPPELAGPVAVQLSKPVREIPAAHALPGGCLYEPKWDGYRLVAVRGGSSTRVWSKQGRDLTDRFPDVVAAAVAQVPAGTVLDGEVVIWNGSRLDFGLLQQRMATAPSQIPALVAAFPASYAAYDLLASGGAGRRGDRPARRRAQLEA